MKNIEIEKLLRVYVISSSLAIILLLFGVAYLALELRQTNTIASHADDGVGALSQSFSNYCLSATQDANRC